MFSHIDVYAVISVLAFPLVLKFVMDQDRSGWLKSIANLFKRDDC